MYPTKSITLKEFKRPSEITVAETARLIELGKKARIVFHDLSNHLTALTLSVEQLEENLARDTKRLREYSKRSEKTRIQMEYVANLLRAHLETTEDTLFNAGHEITSVLETFSHKANMLGLTVSFRLDRSIQIHGSRSAFIHIVTNLISNALESFGSDKNFNKERNQKTRHIRVTLRKNPEEILLTVSDTGCGISMENIARIFNPNFTTKPHGHGIGLSATKEFVEQKFSGHIGASSTTENTTFTVVFPNLHQTTEQITTERAPQMARQSTYHLKSMEHQLYDRTFDPHHL